ncbi:flagellar protein [Paenibacillus sp. MZ04-78.2]|uniref:flagellar protein n=1 Tax=Paenibacillus sp. MZ04-78.2 TaxID=2962034 RepID=UPI0020B8A000|nr:flagellar protein [Paenibacillus sp. MZ04-78.2]MCP3772527.1 flagellar protein [Paenibacillus sp. MZ04-78.2]
MTMLKVANCPNCGKVFQKNLRNLCQDCIDQVHGDFDRCEAYLRGNRKATTEELSRATGVSAKRIAEFIVSNRLPVAYYSGLTYPCNSCGSPIKQHHLCNSCRIRIVNDIHKMNQQEAKRKERGVGFQIRDRLSH